jgi:hypothetical protein
MVVKTTHNENDRYAYFSRLLLTDTVMKNGLVMKTWTGVLGRAGRKKCL